LLFHFIKKIKIKNKKRYSIVFWQLKEQVERLPTYILWLQVMEKVKGKQKMWKVFVGLKRNILLLFSYRDPIFNYVRRSILRRIYIYIYITYYWAGNWLTFAKQKSAVKLKPNVSVEIGLWIALWISFQIPLILFLSNTRITRYDCFSRARLLINW